MADEAKETAESLVADIQKRIADAFSIFDHESNNTIDVREVGTVIRTLNCCPSEAELHDMIQEIEGDDSTGYIRFENFQGMMTDVLLKRRYKAQPEEVLMKAFQALDKEGQGFITQEDLTKYMKTEGETFTEEEMDEMISQAVDPDKPVIKYKDYVPFLVVEET